MREGQPKHRQAAKERARLARRRASLAGLPTALIVCEGRCTEPHYLRGLLEHLRVNAANVEIAPGSSTTDAIGLVRSARLRYQARPEFDRIFVVLDGDQRSLAEARVDAAKGIRRRGGGRVPIHLIVSAPCFEYWLLLHFEYTTRDDSSADVVQALKGHVTDYEKADADIFRKVRVGFESAVTAARRASREMAAAGARSPMTDMPVLVEALKAMSPSPTD